MIDLENFFSTYSKMVYLQEQEKASKLRQSFHNDVQRLFSERLRELRQDKKLSQRKLAEETGLSEQSIKKWEDSAINGANKAFRLPTLDNIYILAKYLGCTASYLIGETDDKLPGEVCFEQKYGLYGKSLITLYSLMNSYTMPEAIYLDFINQLLQSPIPLINLLDERNQLFNLKDELDDDPDKEKLISCYEHLIKKEPTLVDLTAYTPNSIIDEIRKYFAKENFYECFEKTSAIDTEAFIATGPEIIYEKLVYYWRVLSPYKKQQLSLSFTTFFNSFVENFHTNKNYDFSHTIRNNLNIICESTDELKAIRICRKNGK